MSPRLASVEASRPLRSERVALLKERLRAGSFDAAHYESTPRRRAEILAQVLNRCVSPGAMRRRLRTLGVSPEFCRASLLAVSVEGGGIDVRLPDGRGQVVTGPGLDERLLAAFPELVPFTLTNLTLVVAPPAQPSNYEPAVDIQNSAGGVYSVAASGVESWELTLFSSSYTATAATGRYTTTVQGPIAPPISYQGRGSADFLYGSISYPLTPRNAGGLVGVILSPIVWPADGLNWIQINAEQFDPILAAFDAEGTGVNAGDGFGYNLSGTCDTLVITYTDTGCDTCDLSIQVNSSCDGNIVDGGTFDLGNGQSCVQSAGTCTISGIPHGTYNWTWTKDGYDPQSGVYECECKGVSSTIFLDVMPTGGCPGTCTFIVNVTGYCDGDELEGVLVNVTGPDGYDEDCVTGADGICTFAGLQPGDYVVTIFKNGWQGPVVLERTCTNG